MAPLIEIIRNNPLRIEDQILSRELMSLIKTLIFSTLQNKSLNLN